MFIAILFSIASFLAPDSQAATTVVRGDIYANTPAQGIVLDDPGVFGKSDFEFSTSRPTIFKKVSSFKQHHSFSRAVTFNGSANTLQTYTDAFSMKWNNVGTDQDGDRIDVKLVCTKLEIKYEYKGQGSYQQYPTTTSILGQAGNYLDIAPQWYWYMRAEIAFYAYKTGTTNIAKGMFLTEVKDLDCAEIWVKSGSSYVNDYNSSWAESIRLISGYGDKAYITQNNFLNITDNGTWFRPTKGDNETYDSGVIFSLSPNGGKIGWSGNNTSATMLFYSFQPYYITATKGDGGAITKEGKTIAGWKTTPTYTATASKYYRVKSVTVDGATISIPANSKTFSYAFSPVTSNRTIDARFEKIPVTLSYDKNLATATGSTPSKTVDAGTATPVSTSGFTASGYTFKSWNTKADGTGTTYNPGTSITMGESNVILYAQWEPISYEIVETHTTGGQVTPPDTTRVPWHGEQSYAITADTGYEITSVRVDDETDIEITDPKNMEYTFSAVESNHKIDIVFTPAPVKIIYDKNLESATGTTDGADGMLGDTVPASTNGYTAERYYFIEWNTETDGSGMRFMPGDDIELLRDVTVLYAIWGENPCLAITVEGHGTVTVSKKRGNINLEDKTEDEERTLGVVENDGNAAYIIDMGGNACSAWAPSDMWYLDSIEVDGETVDLQALSDVEVGDGDTPDKNGGNNGHLFDISLLDKTLRIDNMTEDHTIKFIFLPMVAMPETGGAGHLIISIIGFTVLAMGMTGIYYAGRRKRSV